MYEFVTGERPPLAWLEAAAASQPSLRFGLKWADRSQKAAFEVLYQRGVLIHSSQVSYHSWVMAHGLDKSHLFAELKGLLRFPDGRVPRKRKLKAADVEARLRKAGAYTHAVMLFAYHSSVAAASAGVGAAHAAADVEGEPPLRQVRLFHELVLPEFVAWLRSSDGLALA